MPFDTKPRWDIRVGMLYPDLTPEQHQEAAYYWSRYLDIIERIYLRTHEKTVLTDSERAGTV